VLVYFYDKNGIINNVFYSLIFITFFNFSSFPLKRSAGSRHIYVQLSFEG